MNAMHHRIVLAAIALLIAPVWSAAADYRVEATKEAPGGDLSADIAALVAPQGFKIVQGEKRVVCEIWPLKQWTTKADFQPSDTVLFPLEPGTLVGVLRFPRKGADFRDQEIPPGLYTLRYGNQPVDGKHVGTFATRDFLLMLPVAADTSPAPLAEQALLETSAKSAESAHPAVMPLVKAESAEPSPLKHLEQQDWWTLRLAGKDAKGANLAVDLIVVGKAGE